MTTSTAALDRPTLTDHTAEPLWSRALLLRLAGMVGSGTSFYLLVSSVPLRLAADGPGVAGLATAALLGSAVAGEAAAPWLIARRGYRFAQVVGLLLMGLPALGLPVAGGAGAAVAVCVLRGFGFAFVTVAGGALTAQLLPATRRGEGMAVIGLASTVPAVLALSGGVWLTQHAAFTAVCLAASVAALAVIPAVFGVPVVATSADATSSLRHVVRLPDVRRAATLFGAVTAAVGVLLTFLPMAISGHAGLAGLALLLHNAAAAVARLVAGRHGDRHGPAALLVPGAGLVVAGLVLIASGVVPLVVVGALAVGLGFGLLQNATLCGMYAAVDTTSYGAVSALWNLAYDAGMGAGALAFGLVVTHTGFASAFLLVAAPIVIAVRRRPTLTR